MQQVLAQANQAVKDSLHDKTSEELASFFRDWLVDHILGADRHYAEHILAGAPLMGGTG